MFPHLVLNDTNMFAQNEFEFLRSESVARGAGNWSWNYNYVLTNRSDVSVSPSNLRISCFRIPK